MRDSAEPLRRPARPAILPPGLALFLCMFAGQAGVIALSPVLPEVARDFDVSTATAGQLRAVSGLVAGATALGMGVLTRRFGVRDLLLLGLSVQGLGALVSAGAPSFGVLAGAQVAVGAGLAIVLTGGVAGTAEWVRVRHRSRALSWSLIGPPSAWIIGMPAIGAAGQVSWRLGWAVPLAACVVAALGVAARPRDEPAEGRRQPLRGLLRDRALAGWALGEILAFSAWTGTVVYVGALFIESYDVSTATAGLLLAAGAAAYLPGNFLARRWVESSSRALLVALALALAAVVVVFGAWRPALGVSAVVFALLSFLAGGRTIAGSAFGLAAAPERRVYAMRIRAAALQFGYLIGSVAGGVALASGGYPALGVTFGVLFAVAAAPHALARRAAG